MKVKYIKVENGVARSLPERLKDDATHELNLTNAQYALAGSGKYFVVEDGVPRVPTQEEIDARDVERLTSQSKVEADSIKEELEREFEVSALGKTWDFNENSITKFTLAIALGVDFGWREKGARVYTAITSSDAIVIGLAIKENLSALDATTQDDKIAAEDTQDYSNSNLKALLTEK